MAKKSDHTPPIVKMSVEARVSGVKGLLQRSAEIWAPRRWEEYWRQVQAELNKVERATLRVFARAVGRVRWSRKGLISREAYKQLSADFGSCAASGARRRTRARGRTFLASFGRC